MMSAPSSSSESLMQSESKWSQLGRTNSIGPMSNKESSSSNNSVGDGGVKGDRVESVDESDVDVDDEDEAGDEADEEASDEAVDEAVDEAGNKGNGALERGQGRGRI